MSTISGVSDVSTSIFAKMKLQKNKQEGPDFTALSEALESGDLAAAKKAYAELKEMRDNAPKPPTADSSITTMDSDFTALGTAIDSGDLTAAKKALSQLQTDMNTFRKTHRPPGPPPGDASNSDTDNSTENGINALA